ncbi:alpha-amylase family glycosyl hydrolase [Shigella sonnei]
MSFTLNGCKEFFTCSFITFYPWSSDDGFSVIDYHQVASEAGEWQDIQQLGECSHLMFDFVCNHMSAKSEWFKNYLQQQQVLKIFLLPLNLKPITAPSLTAYVTVINAIPMRNRSMRHLWTTFSDDQIDLNCRSPEVLLAMVDVLLCYLEKSAEYVRLDASALCRKSRERLHPSGKNTSDYQTVTVEY